MRPAQPAQPRLATPIAWRVRAAVTRAPGGASSLLRLSMAGGAGRLPSSAALGLWIGRAARSLGPAD
jgi:hypothetical protein